MDNRSALVKIREIILMSMAMFVKDIERRLN